MVNRCEDNEKRPLVNKEPSDDDEDSKKPVRMSIFKSYWGCVVVMASFLNLALIDGVGYTTGILLDSLLRDLGGGRSGVAVVGGLQVGVYSLTGPLVGRLINRFGNRPVCVAGALISCLGFFGASFATNLGFVLLGYSVVAGLGFGMMYIPSVVGVAPYFTKRRALAIGICLCGSGVGTFALAPFSQYILDNFGWRWVFRAFSAISLFCVLCGASMAPVDSDEGDDQEQSSTSFRNNSQGFKSKALAFVLGKDLASNENVGVFVLVAVADFLAFTAIYIPYTYLPPLAKVAGVSPEDAAFLISAAGITNTAGRFFSGWLSDQPWAHPLYLTLIAISAAIVPAFVLPWCIAYWTFLLAIGFFGFITGCQVGCTSPMLVKVLGLSCLTPAFGIMTALRGIAAFLGPPAAGFLVDEYLEPGVAFYLCGALMVAACLLDSIASLLNSVMGQRSGYVEF